MLAMFSLAAVGTNSKHKVGGGGGGGGREREKEIIKLKNHICMASSPGELKAAAIASSCFCLLARSEGSGGARSEVVRGEARSEGGKQEVRGGSKK